MVWFFPSPPQATVLSPEDSFDSFEEDCIPESSVSRRDSLKLPIRAQSLNYPKSPRSPRIVTSPSPGDMPGKYRISSIRGGGASISFQNFFLDQVCIQD